MAPGPGGRGRGPELRLSKPVIAAVAEVCLRSDRASVLGQEGMDETAALAAEFVHGQGALRQEARRGATRFAAGAGRHGAVS